MLPLSRSRFVYTFCAALCTCCLSGQEHKPLDLVDLGRIQNLTLGDLEWQEESREQVGDVLFLTGSWKGPLYRGFNASGVLQPERHLSERAKVWIPLDRPDGTEVSQIVWGVQEDGGTRDVPWSACLDLPSRHPVAIIRHAEKPLDWTSLNFANRDHWLFSWWFGFLRRVNGCQATDYRHSNYLLCLAETQLMSITLLSRLLETEGYEPGAAAVGGISKEGWSAWLAAAVDERIVAAAPGNFHIEDMVDGLSSFVANAGCAAGDDNQRATLEWLQTTEAGERALKYFSAADFAAELKPEFLFVFGDVGLFGMHDGRYFTAGAETGFLERFSAVPFRYDRFPDRSGEVLQEAGSTRESYDELRSRQVTQLAHYLLTRNSESHPKVTDAVIESQVPHGTFRVRARVEPTADAVRLWWSHSDSRIFQEPGNAPWVAEAMTREGDLWISDPIAIPGGSMIGWYVEAERELDWEDLTFVQRDTTPQRFFNEFPPLGCEAPPSDCSPPGRPSGLGAVGEDSRVRLDWEDNAESDLRGYNVTRSEHADGVYAILASGLGRSEYTDTDVINGTTYYYKVTAIDVLMNESDPSPYVEATPIAAAVFRRGDCNDDGAVDISDAIFALGSLFLGEGDPGCEDSCDSNDDGTVDISDSIMALGVLFLGNGVIPPPGMTNCGVDPSDDQVGCETHASCP